MKLALHFATIAALSLSGAAKILIEATKSETLTLPTCLGNSLALTLGPAPFHALHCWGGYGLAAGLVWGTGRLLARRQTARLPR